VPNHSTGWRCLRLRFEDQKIAACGSSYMGMRTL
jgi:hypothetical protein